MLLTGKTAVVYGAGGSVGSAVARAYAREGARVHLAGRNQDRLDRVATTIQRARGITSVSTSPSMPSRTMTWKAPIAAWSS